MTTDSDVRSALLRLHGFNLMNHILREYPEDAEIITLVSPDCRACFLCLVVDSQARCVQDLQILGSWELKTRNKVESSGIEELVRKCTELEDKALSTMATELLDYWQSLELGYRIPKAVRVRVWALLSIRQRLA